MTDSVAAAWKLLMAPPYAVFTKVAAAIKAVGLHSWVAKAMASVRVFCDIHQLMLKVPVKRGGTPTKLRRATAAVALAIKTWQAEMRKVQALASQQASSQTASQLDLARLLELLTQLAVGGQPGIADPEALGVEHALHRQRV